MGKQQPQTCKGRQAGRQHVLHPRSNTQGSFQVLCMIFFSFWLVSFTFRAVIFIIKHFFSFFQQKFGIFWEGIVFFLV
jgi:hypothetical protein